MAKDVCETRGNSWRRMLARNRQDYNAATDKSKTQTLGRGYFGSLAPYTGRSQEARQVRHEAVNHIEPN